MKVNLANLSESVCEHAADLRVSIGHLSGTVRFHVLDMGFDVILGKDWLKVWNGQIRGRDDKVFIGDHINQSHTMLPLQPKRQDKPNLLINAFQMTKLLKKKSTTAFLAIVTDKSQSKSLSDLLQRTDEEFRDIIDEFSDVFPEELPPGLPPQRKIDHKIDVRPGSDIPHQRLYRMSDEELKVLRGELKKLLDLGYIRPSISPYGAPVLFAKKKDGGLRMCVDYRGLNSITIRNRYALPRIDEMLDRLFKAKYFTSLDLRSGYNQVRVNPGDAEKTAFRTRYGHYEFLVLSFGLTNAPATFMRLMNDLFHDFLDVFVIVYIDDILVFSETFEDHKEHLRLVLQRLRNEKLFAQPSKCSIGKLSTKFVGFQISRGKISCDESKIKAIKEWPKPRSIRDVQAFLGLANFYRKFIARFSEIAKPLTEIQQKTKQFEWTDVQQQAFKDLKSALEKEPVLGIPDPSRPFVVATDASDFAVGAVLSQDFGEGLQPVAFFSRMLKNAEVNYPVHEKEMLAIVLALKEWRCFLQSRPFKVFTDNKSLEFWKSQRELSRRQARWSEFLQTFDCDIEHVPGKFNAVADALSRRADYKGAAPKTSKPMINAMELKILNRFAARIKTSYADDAEFGSIYGKLVEMNDPTRVHFGFTLRDGFIYRQFRNREAICVPKVPVLRTQLLEQAHELAGHLGVKKTYDQLKDLFWGRMYRHVEEFVSKCHNCSENKHESHGPKGEHRPLSTPSRCFEEIEMDFMVDLPRTSKNNDQILVMTDRLSKYLVLEPVRSTMTAEDVAAIFFNSFYRRFGLPATIISDRDTKFVSKFWQDLQAKIGVSSCMSTSFHKQTVGQVERMNQTVSTMLRQLCGEATDWEAKLPTCEFNYNNSIHATTQQRPFEVVFGFPPKTPLSFPTSQSQPPDVSAQREVVQRAAEEAIATNAMREKARLDLTKRILEFKAGDEVMLSTKNINLPGKHRFKPRFVGPFTIVDKRDNDNYVLDLPFEYRRLHNVFHVSLLKTSRSDNNEGLKVRRPPRLAGTNNANIFEVEALLGQRGQKYLVKWKGYPRSAATWEPRANLFDCPEALASFHKACLH